MKNNIILSGRYELLRCLGSGAFSTVYLARHNSLKRECAIKLYPKNHGTSLSLLSEAQLLRTLHHPGIPEIYDIEEDEEYYYLVEEFIPGESLEEFLSHHNTISQDIFFTFCSQICGIFDYLHSRAEPILYQDLKPEHLIVCGSQLRLIDFGDSCSIAYTSFDKSYSKPINSSGDTHFEHVTRLDHSHSMTNPGNYHRQYGNLDFSAPECISGGLPTITADIYSIGRLIEYLSGYLEYPVSPSLRQIIQTSTMPDPSLRYPTVQALALALETSKKNGHTPHLLQNIAVVGAARGCGSTHISIALTTAINAQGISCFYYEKNDSRCFEQLIGQQTHMAEQPDGSYSYRHFKGFPQYGPGIRISRPEGLALEDYGASFNASDLEQADLILFICPDASWRRDDAIAKTKLLQPYGDRLCFLCNPGEYKAASYYARQFGFPVYRYFYDSDPFRADRSKRKLTCQLLQLPEKGRFASF